MMSLILCPLSPPGDQWYDVLDFVSTSLLQAIDGVMSLILCLLSPPGGQWCDVLDFVSASLLQAINGVMSLILCPPLSSRRSMV